MTMETSNNNKDDSYETKSNSSASISTIHRVHTTGHLLPQDDYITEKTLSQSAANRLGKRSAAFSTNQYKESTEEHFSTEQDAGFYGAYASVRQKLDYSYHVHYRKERQWLHDAIIEDNLLKHQQQHDSDVYDYHQGEPVILPRYPWLILMVGVHGAAKHSTVRQLIDTGRLKLLSLVCADTDDLRRYLPEYATYRDACPSSVDRRTRKEAGYISETLTIAALQAGRNVIFYGSLKDTAWYKDSFLPSLRKQFHGIQVALIHVLADLDVALARAQQRAVATGLVLDQEEFRKQFTNTIPQACQRLRSKVDYYAEIRNNPGGDLELLNQGGDWSHFTKVFDQQGSVLSLSYPDHKIELPSPIVHTHHKRISMIPKISAVASSEDNHAADDMEFYGPFARIRSTLDYSFHRNYTFERQHFQDAIILEFLRESEKSEPNKNGCDLPTHPWAIFTAGAMGAGKGFAIDYLKKQGLFPLMGFVKVNSDAIRRYLPEYHLYIETNPDLAGDLTNKEAGYIAEILALAGLHAGKNILVDGSLRCASWYRNYFVRLQREFPGIRLAIIHVTAPREAIFQRASERALETGRVVPRDLIALTIEEVPKSVAELAPLVDYHVELSNDPEARGIEIVTPGETWENFTAQWVQTSKPGPSRGGRAGN